MLSVWRFVNRVAESRIRGRVSQVRNLKTGLHVWMNSNTFFIKQSSFAQKATAYKFLILALVLLFEHPEVKCSLHG